VPAAGRRQWNGLVGIFKTLRKVSIDSERAALKWQDYGYNDSKVAETLSEATRRFLQFIKNLKNPVFKRNRVVFGLLPRPDVVLGRGRLGEGVGHPPVGAAALRIIRPRPSSTATLSGNAPPELPP
jgi:hypothetical protein